VVRRERRAIEEERPIVQHNGSFHGPLYRAGNVFHISSDSFKDKELALKLTFIACTIGEVSSGFSGEQTKVRIIFVPGEIGPLGYPDSFGDPKTNPALLRLR
jgi:hypothetical protein